MGTFFLIAGMALVTFLIRYCLLPLSGRITFSKGTTRALGRQNKKRFEAMIC